jgi:hypothetical protein
VSFDRFSAMGGSVVGSSFLADGGAPVALPRWSMPNRETLVRLMAEHGTFVAEPLRDAR